MGIGLERPEGLLALLGLLPIIILYLLRPRPRKQTVPSLMFLMRDRKRRTYTAFLQRLVNDPLLLLQLLAVALIAVALAQPYVTAAPQRTTDSIIILDSSASMHASDGRREQARTLARQELGPRTTIIEAGEQPRIAVRDASRTRAQAYLQDWEPADTATRLTAALQAAENLADDQRIVVISDFADTDNAADYEDMVATLRIRGHDVTLLQVGELAAHDNVGIVELDITEGRITALIKNYGEARDVEACAASACQTLSLGAGATIPWTVQPSPGITELVLDVDDALDVDDHAYVSLPTTRELDILVITNGDFSSTPVADALAAVERATPLSITIQEARPPQLPAIDHDIIIFSDVDGNLLVGGTVRETLEAVREGAAAVVVSQPDVFGLGLSELLPLVYEGQGGGSALANAQTIERFNSIAYHSTPSYHRAKAPEQVIPLASAADGTPVIAITPLGQGRVLWYDIPRGAAFTNAPDYPIFWKNALSELAGREEPATLNRRAGDALIASSITPPSGDVAEGSMTMDSVGIYRTPRGVYAANLMNAEESDVSVPALAEGAALQYHEAHESGRASLTALFAILALLIVLAELAYTRWRGDI